MEAIIKLENAVIRQQKNTILKDVSLEIKEGEFVYLIGKVGSGKTSLLKTLYAELPLIYGKGEVAGYQLSKIKKSQIAYLRRKCGIVLQDFKLLTDRNVYANLEFVLKATGWKKKSEIKERIDNVLRQVGMQDKGYKMPHELSGGEQQRIVIARALLNNPKLILADEPTGALDSKSTDELLGVFERINQSGQTILMVTHHMEEVILADRIIVMDQGKIIMDGKPKEIFSRVDEMKTLGLEVPYATELAWELKKEGVNLSDTITTKEELVEELCQFV